MSRDIAIFIRTDKCVLALHFAFTVDLLFVHNPSSLHVLNDRIL
jgi:hypothetical protein